MFYNNPMRKIIFQMMVTLDGFFAGPNGEIDWHVVDEEFNEYAFNFLNSLDMLLFGRVTYQGMANYWPTPAAKHDDPIISSKMNSISKVVFSTTLDKVEWENTRLVKENVLEEVLKLKLQSGKDIAIFGSSNFSLTLVKHHLIDEYRIIVNPVLLGKGKPLFMGLEEKIKLKLTHTQSLRSGDVILYYRTDPETASSKEAYPWRKLLA